jgi:hypothetical protein
LEEIQRGRVGPDGSHSINSSVDGEFDEVQNVEDFSELELTQRSRRQWQHSSGTCDDHRRPTRDGQWRRSYDLAYSGPTWRAM